MLKINEVFFSIQGESSLSGYPTVFIRTSGCHLRCTYCDTTYAYHKGETLSIESLIEHIKRYSTRYICITGGEPLLQADVYPLMTQLCDLGYSVSLETSGDKSCHKVDSRVRKIIDIKTPDSGEPNAFHYDNLKLEDQNLEYKFVICSEKDFYWAEDFMKQHKRLDQFLVYYSPSYHEFSAQKLAELILENQSQARLQIQLHKSLWPDTEQGV